MYVHVYKTPYERSGKKYMDILLNDNDMKYVQDLQILQYMKNETPFFNPLDGNILTIKIPWRYNKIDYIHVGLTTIFEICENDPIYVELNFKGLWGTKTAHGFSWVLHTMNTNRNRGKVFH